MFTRVAWAAFALIGCISGPSPVAAQDTAYHFTSGVTNPAPVPGQPFTLTWTGGQPNETVYIVLQYLFPDTPNQVIVYESTDILSDAPNNGSWTYNVPLNINQGRYEFAIGINPILLSDSTAVFTILPSQTSSVPPGSAPSPTTNTAYQTYNGCGLVPFPDYTYPGYQAPCTTTVNGQVETIYPIVPTSDSASFFGTSYLAATDTASDTGSSSSPTSISTSTYDSAYAPGVFAQALQCRTPVSPSATRTTAGGTTTIFSTVGCNLASPTVTASANNDNGVCYSSGYQTFSVSGMSSVCCPTGWTTTPLNADLFCFTSFSLDARRAVFENRQVSTETLVVSPSPLVAIDGLAFTRAGVVTNRADATSTTGSATSAGATLTSGTDEQTNTKTLRKRIVVAVAGVMYMVHCLI